MNPKWKLTAYLVLLILAAFFAWEFYSKYSAVTKPAADTASNAPPATPNLGTNASTNPPTNALAGTNPASAPDTNALALPDTNAAALLDATAAALPDANAAALPDTNAAAVPNTNVASTSGTHAPAIHTHAPAPAVSTASQPAPATAQAAARGAMIGYLAAFIGAAIGLGLLIAYDVTQIIGNQAVNYLLDDVGEGLRDPEYERAEAEWAKGKYLDAIQMMRDFLKKNPREIYAALRIAEIYEKDLKNPLAAALEYEEVLRHKLPAERWGWAAVHLCNLYSKLNQSDKALALLRRVADDYPKTRAAKKARARLGMAEPEPEADVEAADAAEEVESSEQAPAIIMEERPPELEPRAPSPPSPPPEPPKPNLPPGFRPKK